MLFVGRECCNLCKECKLFSKRTIVAGVGSSKPTMLSSFHSLSFSDVLLATGGALEHNLFLRPLVTSFGFVHFWLRLGFFLFILPFPLGWPLRLMKFTKVSSK